MWSHGTNNPRGRPPVSVYLPYETLTKEEGVLVGGEGFFLTVGGSAEAVVWAFVLDSFLVGNRRSVT